MSHLVPGLVPGASLDLYAHFTDRFVALALVIPKTRSGRSIQRKPSILPSCTCELRTAARASPCHACQVFRTPGLCFFMLPSRFGQLAFWTPSFSTEDRGRGSFAPLIFADYYEFRYMNSRELLASPLGFETVFEQPSLFQC